MQISGEKINLRPMTYDDTDNIVRWRANKRVRNNFLFRGEITKEVHEEWIRTRVETGEVVQFIIEEAESGRPIGSTYLRDINREIGKAEFGIFIGEDDAVGRGYGTEAAKLIVKYAFSNLKLHKVYLRVLDENLVAKKSYEKVGFKEEGHFRDEVFLNGEYKDVIFMAIFDDGEKECSGLVL
ncbi:UDP-4-amino-4,6-dideoxy-N-acetyl-beta-L-altrosamine N-acetyltransferase [Lachnospiraceae bacterium G11]|nr:UDP-4-amino-4,6-dideoxy-N-acetyl-beta-L-altrosamine N-acetyltransferase [Lachnospiraceae bacterium G11]